MTAAQIAALPVQSKSRLIRASDTGAYYAIAAGQSGTQAKRFRGEGEEISQSDVQGLPAMLSELGLQLNLTQVTAGRAENKADIAIDDAVRLEWWVKNGCQIQMTISMVEQGAYGLVADPVSMSFDFASFGMLPAGCESFIIGGWGPAVASWPQLNPNGNLSNVGFVNMGAAPNLPPLAPFLTALNGSGVENGYFAVPSSSTFADGFVDYAAALDALETAGWVFENIPRPSAEPPAEGWMQVPADGSLSAEVTGGNYKAARGFSNGGTPVLSAEGTEILFFTGAEYDVFSYSPGPYSDAYVWPDTYSNATTYHAGYCYVNRGL